VATFLAKTEPSEYSIDDLLADDITTWSGVRNPTAVKAIRAMQPGDRLLIYHSGKSPAIVGEGQIVSDPRPDLNETRSWVIDVRFLHRFNCEVSLAEIKESGLFDDWALVRLRRLSTMSVPEHFLVWFWERLREAD
jgi:predicted RNA-binding protein with PUA-like domain